MKFYRLSALFLIFVIALTTSGCWDYTEMNNLSIVAGIAIDKDKGNGGYNIAVELINIEAGDGQSKITPKILKCNGPTIFDAVRGLVKKTGRKLYWAHAKVVIFGEEAAREGIAPALDWIVRDAEVRSEMYILLSREKTAAEMLEFNTTLEELISFQIATTMQVGKSVEHFYKEDIWHFINDLASPGVSDIIPSVERAKLEKDKLINITGSGVFKKDKLIGWISGEETKNILFVKDEIKNGTFTLENVQGTKNNVTFELEATKTNVVPSYRDNRFVFDVYIKPSGVIAEINGDKDFIEEKNRDRLKKYTDKAMEKRIKTTTDRIQNEFGSDVLGFADIVERKMPSMWKKVNKNWQEEFQRAQINIHFDFEITGSATVIEPIKVEE